MVRLALSPMDVVRIMSRVRLPEWESSGKRRQYRLCWGWDGTVSNTAPIIRLGPHVYNGRTLMRHLFPPRKTDRISLCRNPDCLSPLHRHRV